MTGQEIRYQVRSTKGLFMDLFLYFFGNSLFILMWYVFDRNEPFWPKYIMLVWGVASQASATLPFKTYPLL